MLKACYHYLEHQFWQLFSIADYYLQTTYTGRTLANFWDLATQLWYFAAVGALLSTLIWRFLPKARIRTLLLKRANASIVAASLLGLISPMCTFAAIPVVAGLITAGVPAPPLVAFLVASPLMNPSLFAYTAGVIGTEMALARLLTAGSMGLIAGVATRLALRYQLFDFAYLAAEKIPGGVYQASASSAESPRWTEVGTLLRHFWSDLAFIARFFALGIFIAALVKTLLTEELILSVMGPASAWAVPLAVVLGVPLYACGGGSIPIVEIMMRMGMTSGAALAFFIAGPATKFSTLAVLGAVFGRRILTFYLVVMLSGALLWGYAYPFDRQQLDVRQGYSNVYEGPVPE